MIPQHDRAKSVGFMGRCAIVSFLPAIVGLYANCGSDDRASAGGVGGARTNGGASPTSTGGSGTGGAPIPPCTPEAEGPRTHTAGNYDNQSCRKAGCHKLEVGGWVYASRRGYPWVGGATITITNPDGSSLTIVSGEDGFFSFGQSANISSPYQVCASKCPSTDCNATLHTSVDCQAPGCHTSPIQRIYTTTTDLGGTGGAGGQNCKPPAPGGPYVHLETVYSAANNLPCVGCHADPDFIGGFLYDGPTGIQTVAEATITLTPGNGSALTAVTGPDGMYFFGRNGITAVPESLPTPYTPCVSKCPTGTICSPTQHTTNADCGTCHGWTRDKLYLR
jgi:hypothetical protein